MRRTIIIIGLVMLICLLTMAGEYGEKYRTIPKPLPNHPGNIFLEGEFVTVMLPKGDDNHWLATDYDGKTIAEGEAVDGKANVGNKLGVGYYEVRRSVGKALVTVGVLAALKSPTPLTSPIGVDVAMSGFYKYQLYEASNLCALAGMNRVRDRLNWWEMEPKKDAFVEHNNYDDAARVQATAGLQILQVGGSPPKWASSGGIHFPSDLRDVYKFYKEMATRWKGKVTAFEPCNEPELGRFGGHSGTEIASIQKAAYLGLKAGNPGVIVCSAPLASCKQWLIDDLKDNEWLAYCDTYNFHHYVDVGDYPKLYAAHRTASGGRPIWVSECNIPIHQDGDEKGEKPTWDSQRIQAEQLATVYAGSLYENVEATFYFLLPHFLEGKFRFGVLHPDLTPYPGFLALAAVGRLLADAKPLGLVQTPDRSISAYLFSAKPDGQPCDVLVVWSRGQDLTFELPVKPTVVYDHLGRLRRQVDKKLSITHSPLFALLPVNTEKSLKLIPPPECPKKQKTQISPVVFQMIWPNKDVSQSTGNIPIAQERAYTIVAYNFSEKPACGTLTTVAPQGWIVKVPETIELAPYERKEITLKIVAYNKLGTRQQIETVKIIGQFPQGKTLLSFRLQAILKSLAMDDGEKLPLSIYDTPECWQQNISKGGSLKIEAPLKGIPGIHVIAKMVGSERWIYPTVNVSKQVIPSYPTALQLTLTPLKGKASYSVLFIENSGSTYGSTLVENPKLGKTLQLTVNLSNVWFGTFSKSDPNGKLDLDDLKAISIGANTKEEEVEYQISGVKWVK